MSKSFKQIKNLLGILKTTPIPPLHCQIDLQYAGKEVYNAGKSSDGPDCDYLNEEGRAPYLLVGREESEGDFKLYDKTGKPADTSHFSGKFGPGYAAYAIDRYGRMFIHEHVSFKNVKKHTHYFFHSSFLSGQVGLCFGMCTINNGKIEYIDNRSGHYKPSKLHLKNAAERLMPYFAENAKVYCQETIPEEKEDATVIYLAELFHEEHEVLNECSVSEFMRY